MINFGGRLNKVALPTKMAVAMGLHIYYIVYWDESSSGTGSYNLSSRRT